MIILRQKWFSKRSQKLLRRASDFKKGIDGSGRIASKEELKKITDYLSRDPHSKEKIRLGRKINDRSANIGPTIHDSINSKAVNTNDFSALGSASGNRLAPKDSQYPKKWLKKDDLKSYDHSHSSSGWNKEEMELARDLKINRR